MKLLGVANLAVFPLRNPKGCLSHVYVVNNEIIIVDNILWLFDSFYLILFIWFILYDTFYKTIKGKVTEISHSAKNTGGQYIVKIRLNKTNTNVLSGMYTAVQFPVTKKTTTSDIILIPKKAIITRGQLSGIYTVSQSKTAILRWLRLGKTFGDKIEVLSGLSADEKFILSSEEKLINGAKLNIQ